jgi:anti-sigma factor RsiW
MEHVKDIELIELVGNRLEPEREKLVRGHLGSCADCQAKFEELGTTWDLLGAWEVSPLEGVEVANVRTVERPRPLRTIRLIQPAVLLRVAASVGVAALIGYTAGRWSIGPNRTTASLEPPSYLSVLGLEAGESFSPLVLDEDTSTVEGG